MSGFSTTLREFLFKSISSKHRSTKDIKGKEELKKAKYSHPDVIMDEKRQLEYPPSIKENRIKHLSSTANLVASYSAKVLSTSVEKLWHDFDETTQAHGMEHLEHARSFLEYCCFKAFSILTRYENHLYEKSFHRYTFDCMVAWETPNTKQPCLQEENFEVCTKEEEDEHASHFFTDLMPMLVDAQDTVGIDAFVRVAPCITIVADIVSARLQFETLTTSTSGRMPFPVYEKYLAALEKYVKEMKAKQESVFVHDLPMSQDEHILEVDGTWQTVIQHVGSKAVSGRLTLTDRALYFEQSSITSYHDAVKFNLAADLDHGVFSDLSGPWGSRIFDKAINYRNTSLSLPVVFEFPDLIGSTRRDYWLALVQEVIDCHIFMRKYRLEESCQQEAIARAVLGIIRLRAIRDCTQLLPSKLGALLIFNLPVDFLPLGDLVFEALANTIKDATPMATEEAKAAFDKSDGSIEVPISAVKLLKCLFLWRGSKTSAPVYRMKAGELTALERAMIDATDSSKQTQKVKALEEEVKLDGLGVNVAVMNELLKPVLAFFIWSRDVVSWNRPLHALHFFIILAYIIYRDWLGYILPLSLTAAGVFIIWLKLTNKATKYKEIVVHTPSGGVSLQQVVTMQRVVSQFQGILQAANVILLKIWALTLSVKPEATSLLPCMFFSLALVLAVLPFRVLVLAIIVVIFSSRFRNRASESKIERRLRELWHSIPPLPVRMESEVEKQIREASQG